MTFLFLFDTILNTPTARHPNLPYIMQGDDSFACLWAIGKREEWILKGFRNLVSIWHVYKAPPPESSVVLWLVSFDDVVNIIIILLLLFLKICENFYSLLDTFSFGWKFSYLSSLLTPTPPSAVTKHVELLLDCGLRGWIRVCLSSIRSLWIVHIVVHSKTSKGNFIRCDDKHLLTNSKFILLLYLN